MTFPVDINPELITWARERAGFSPNDLIAKFKKLSLWESGSQKPTLKQLEKFAKTTSAPIGYFFLPEPPQEKFPIPDFRTIANRDIEKPSVNLLDTIYLCQQRQEWYRDFARKAGEPPLDFVGSARKDDEIEKVAAEMRSALGFNLEERQAMGTWTDALRQFIKQADDLGILVMVSGVVGSNTHRKLDTKEFRGFALYDEIAPLVFINGTDAKAAQMFTLAHELAHIWLGESALSNIGSTLPSNQIEKWCNKVAAELLVPLAVLKDKYNSSSNLENEVNRMARAFKVSTLVILHQLKNANIINNEEFQQAYDTEISQSKNRKSGAGDFYLTTFSRTGKRFASAIVGSTFEGQNSFTEALRLMGTTKITTLRKFGVELGVLT